MLVLSWLASLSSFLPIQALSSGISAVHIQEESPLGTPSQIHSGRTDGGVRRGVEREGREVVHTHPRLGPLQRYGVS